MNDSDRPSKANGWQRYEEHVLRKLDELREDNGHLYRKVNRLCQDVERLKVKSSLWGALGGLVPVVIVIAMALLRQM